jgi:cell division protein FtsQ
MRKPQHLYKRYRKQGKKKVEKLGLIKWIALLLIISSAALSISALLYHLDIHGRVAKVMQTGINSTDWTIKHIVIVGAEHVLEDTVREIIGFSEGDATMAVDIFVAKQKLEKNSWIDKASIKRDGVDAIIIEIEEEVPQAIYEQGGRYWLINAKGRLIDAVDPSMRPELVRVCGKDANLYYAAILKEVSLERQLMENIEQLRFIDGRRWDIILKNNIILKLPSMKVAEALDVFSKYFKADIQLKSKCIVDLRLIPDKIYLKELK